jgi:hypothetical protein
MTDHELADAAYEARARFAIRVAAAYVGIGIVGVVGILVMIAMLWIDKS